LNRLIQQECNKLIKNVKHDNHIHSHRSDLHRPSSPIQSQCLTLQESTNHICFPNYSGRKRHQTTTWLIYLTHTWPDICLWESTEVSVNMHLMRFENILIRLPQINKPKYILKALNLIWSVFGGCRGWIRPLLCKSLIWSNCIGRLSLSLEGRTDTWLTLCGGLQ